MSEEALTFLSWFLIGAGSMMLLIEVIVVMAAVIHWVWKRWKMWSEWRF